MAGLATHSVFWVLAALCLILNSSLVVSDGELLTTSKSDNEDSTTISKLIEKINNLEQNMEKKEKQMKNSIRALIETNARFRLTNFELEKRVKALEKISAEKEKAIQYFLNVLEYNPEIDDRSCLKAGISDCNAEKEDFLDVNGDSKQGIFTASLTLTGVYLFTWAATARKLAGECSYDIWVKLMVNGNYKICASAESRNDWDDHQGSSTAILRLSKGWVGTAHYSAYPNRFSSNTLLCCSMTISTSSSASKNTGLDFKRYV